MLKRTLTKSVPIAALAVCLTSALFATTGPAQANDQLDDAVRVYNRSHITITARETHQATLLERKPREGRKQLERTCHWGEQTVPCEKHGGTWNERHQCWMKGIPQPPRSDERWGGATSGRMALCTLPFGTSFGRTLYVVVDDAPGTDPEQLAHTAIERMRLAPPTIGTAPRSLEKAPNAMGFVGKPVWMWIANPNEETYGPVTRTATAGTSSVTATARVVKTTWNMGDGKTVTCRSAGAVWTPTSSEKSPNCGHIYAKQGIFTVTATAHWEIIWAGMGSNGKLSTQLTSTAQLAIGEIQVVNVYPKKGKKGSS